METLQSRKVRTKMDRTILILTYFLVTIGIVMIFSASSVQARAEQGSSVHFLRSQVMYVVLGTLALVLGINFNYRNYKKIFIPILIINFALLLLTLVLPPIKGVRRWIRIASFSFQASEFSKFAVILSTAYFLDKYKKDISKFLNLLFPISIMIITVLLIIKQPSLSASMTIAATSFITLFIGGMSILHGLIIVFAGGVGMYVMSKLTGYGSNRIESFLQPFEDMSGKGWQVANSLFAISSGGMFGVGFGKSAQKFFYISEPQNDFIFAVIAEELGFFMCMGIILVFIFLIFKMFRVALQTRDIFGRMLVIGIAVQIGVQVFLNIGVATSSVPNTGVGLPFISYGGTSILMFLFMIGIVLNVSRNRN